MLIYLITFTFMFHFKKFQIRMLRDADSGNGGGVADPAGGTPVVAGEQPPAGGGNPTADQVK